MEQNKDSRDEKDIQKMEQLLNDVSKFSEEIGSDEAGRKKPGLEEPITKSVRSNLGIKSEGSMEIRVSVEGMTAFADFYPPEEGARPFTLDDVSFLVKQKKIKTGILWETIKEALRLCETKKKQVDNVLIARGKAPVDEIPASYTIEETLLKKEEDTDTEDSEVDFKEKSPFILVKKGQVLAKKIPAVPGELGVTVLGNSLPYKTTQKQKIMAGKNVRAENDVYVAACDGRFQHKGSSFWVDEVLFVETGVDYKTGHIDFPGDIIIKGLVRDGFKINAGKSIACQSTLDASEVFCKGDLLVHNGIIGKKEGIVKVNGRIKAKFIENCNIEANGMIEIKKSIINSKVKTLDKILLGDRGVIIGGYIVAQTGIEARQIGSDSSPRTEIYCGIDFMVQDKLEWIKAKNKELSAKIEEIRNRLNRSQKGDAKLFTLRENMENAMEKLNQTARTLLFHLDKNEDAKIIVRGIIYPGSIIEICHIRYVVKSVLPRVVFSLNRRKGKIEIKTF